MACGWQYKAKLRWSLTTFHFAGGYDAMAPEELHVSGFLAVRVTRLSAQEEGTTPSQACCRILRPPNAQAQRCQKRERRRSERCRQLAGAPCSVGYAAVQPYTQREL